MEKNLTTLRVALIGPESTAKSSLTKAMAEHYNTLYIEEYSRSYISDLNREYILEDILVIAQQQLNQELTALTAANKIIFVDTELIIAKVWCEDVFKTCPEWITKNITELPYDLYLLTYPDLPWETDNLRENGHRREFFFDWYEKELKTLGANYAIIRGTGNTRIQNCICAIEDLLNNPEK